MHPGDRRLALDRLDLAAVNSVSQGTTETTRANLVPTGAAANYVSGGEVRVRVRCTTTAGNFVASGELLQVTYEAP